MTMERALKYLAGVVVAGMAIASPFVTMGRRDEQFKALLEGHNLLVTQVLKDEAEAHQKEVVWTDAFATLRATQSAQLSLLQDIKIAQSRMWDVLGGKRGNR